MLSCNNSIKNNICFMASSVSRQDEPNRVLWLATGGGKMELSCSLRTTHCVWQEKFPQNPLLTKLFRSRWLDIGLILFCMFVDRDGIEVHKHAKKNLANGQPSWPHTWSITHIMWLAPRAGKMNQITLFHWLSERALAHSGLPAVSCNPLLTKFVWSRWLDIGLVLFLRVYGQRRSRGP